MNRGDVVLLILWCVMAVVGSRLWGFSTSTTVIAVIVGGAVFGLRLYLARRTFR